MYIVFNDNVELPEDALTYLVPLNKNQYDKFVYKMDDLHALPKGSHVATNAETVPSLDIVTEIKERIETASDEFHTRFLGISSAFRNSRFQENAIMAREYLSNTANTTTIVALEIQKDIRNQTMSLSLTLAEFCQWIVNLHDASRRILGEIEAFLMHAKYEVENTPNLVDIEVRTEYLNELRNEAENKYSILTT